MPKDLLRDLEEHDKTREVLRKLLSMSEPRKQSLYVAAAAHYPSVNVDNGATLHIDSGTVLDATGDLYMTDVEQTITTAAAR